MRIHLTCARISISLSSPFNFWQVVIRFENHKWTTFLAITFRRKRDWSAKKQNTFWHCSHRMGQTWNYKISAFVAGACHLCAASRLSFTLTLDECAKWFCQQEIVKRAKKKINKMKIFSQFYFVTSRGARKSKEEWTKCVRSGGGERIL